jgi:hypothetical protein
MATTDNDTGQEVQVAHNRRIIGLMRIMVCMPKTLLRLLNVRSMGDRSRGVSLERFARP